MDEFVTLNGKLTFPCPEGFHVMTADERGKLTIIGDGPGELLSDPERHITISVAYRPLGTLAALVLNAKDAAKNMESKLRKAMRSFEYRRIAFLSREAGDKKAEGFSYEYESKGIGMYGESFAVIEGKVLFNLHFYTRTTLKEENTRLWEKLLSAVRWL